MTPEPETTHAPLTRHEHPALWQQIDEVASLIGFAPPDHAGLVVHPNAHNETTDAGSYLFIGLPLFTTLSVAELRAVIARLIARSAMIPDTRAPLDMSSAALREVSSAADECSLKVTGLESAVSSLHSCYVADVAFELMTENTFNAMDTVGMRGRLTQMLTAIHDRLGPELASVAQHLMDAEHGTPDDPHHTMAERVTALREGERTALETHHDTRPSIVLLADDQHWLDYAEGAMCETLNLPVREWHDIQLTHDQSTSASELTDLAGRVMKPGFLGRGTATVTRLVRATCATPDKRLVLGDNETTYKACLVRTVVAALRRDGIIRRALPTDEGWSATDWRDLQWLIVETGRPTTFVQLVAGLNLNTRDPEAICAALDTWGVDLNRPIAA